MAARAARALMAARTMVASDTVVAKARAAAELRPRRRRGRGDQLTHFSRVRTRYHLAAETETRMRAVFFLSGLIHTSDWDHPEFTIVAIALES